MDETAYREALADMLAESEGRDAGLVAAARRVLMLDGMVESMDRYALKGWQYDAVRREIADLIEKLTR